jgi:flagellar FliL protein
MAEEDEERPDDAGEGEDGEDGEDGEKGTSSRWRRLPGRKLVLFVALPLLVLGGAAGGVIYSGLLAGSPATPQEMAARSKEFFEMPEMLVNLADHGEERARYLKLQVALELPGREARDALTPVLPRVIDLFQVYLRELRSDDLDGSAGIYRLKEELVRRINLEISPYEVSDVLFKEIIVQ